MPGFDGTGPLGAGPMTGRGMGYCAMPMYGAGAPVRVASYGPATGPYGFRPFPYAPGPYYGPFGGPFLRRGLGRGLARGRGWGRGRGRGRGWW